MPLVQLLAFLAPKAAPLLLAGIFLVQPGAMLRAGLLIVYFEVRIQLMRFAPAQEILTEINRFMHDLSQLARWYMTYWTFRLHARPVKRFILNDIAYARKNILIHQHIADHRLRWLCFDELPHMADVPFIAHNICAPVIYFFNRLLNVAHRAGVKIQLCLVIKYQMKLRRAFALFIDVINAEHQKVNTQREVAAKVKKQVLATCKYAFYRTAFHPGRINGFKGSVGSIDLFPFKLQQLFPEDNERRAFWHNQFLYSLVEG